MWKNKMRKAQPDTEALMYRHKHEIHQRCLVVAVRALHMRRGSAHAEGTAAEVHTDHVQKEIKGKTIR